MFFQRPISLRLQARQPSARDRVVVVTEDADFWLGLRQEAPDLEASFMLAHTARECLMAVEDPRVQAVVLDGTLIDKPAIQLIQLLKQIRPTLSVILAYCTQREDLEREARQAGVLYYGDRSALGDMVGVVRQCLRRVGRLRPRPGELPSRETRG